MIDLEMLGEDPEAPCYDGGKHDYRIDSLDPDRIVCKRGCGADVSVGEFEDEDES